MSRRVAVVAGQLCGVSASQIVEYLRCRRSWWYSKVARLPRPFSEPASAGVTLHKELEDYYRHGYELTSPVLQALRDGGLLPAPTPEMLIEEPLENPSLEVEGIPFSGYVDLLTPPVDGVVRIRDWKTVSSFRYCKTPEELQEDIQQNAYAMYSRMRWPEAESVTIELLYILRGAPEGPLAKVEDEAPGVRNVFIFNHESGRPCRIARSVRVEATWEQVSRNWTRVAEAVLGMKRTAEAQEADVPRPVDYAGSQSREAPCAAFGGCSFYATCWPLRERLGAGGEE